jgi:hypothetical protein
MSISIEEGLKYFVEFYKQLDENQKKLVIERFRTLENCRAWKGGWTNGEKDNYKRGDKQKTLPEICRWNNGGSFSWALDSE